MPKLTKTVVDAAGPDPAGRRRFVWDSKISGFGLLVLPSGVKSFFYQYRTPEGRSRRATIGKFGTWTAEQARIKAEDWQAVVKAGGDPLATRTALREAPTVAQMLDAYVESESFAQKADATRYNDVGRIERHLRPLLGRRHLHSLTPEDIDRAMSAIRDGRTRADRRTGKPRGRSRVRGGPMAARDSMALLRSAFTWAVRERIATENPCRHLRLPAAQTRDAILESADEYRRLFEALDTMERQQRIRGPVADAIRVVALTGARSGEIAGLRWRHVDLGKGVITLPPSAHKTGRRTGKPRVIALPAPAQACIARQPAGDPDSLVFAASRGKHPLDLSQYWRRKVKRKDGERAVGVAVEAELPAGIGMHGLRHSVGSHLAMAGAEAAQIMTALGHRQLSTAARYIHFADDARKALAERAASVALAGLAAASAAEDDTGAEVKALDRGAKSK